MSWRSDIKRYRGKGTNLLRLRAEQRDTRDRRYKFPSGLRPSPARQSSKDKGVLDNSHEGLELGDCSAKADRENSTTNPNVAIRKKAPKSIPWMMVTSARKLISKASLQQPVKCFRGEARLTTVFALDVRLKARAYGNPHP